MTEEAIVLLWNYKGNRDKSMSTDRDYKQQKQDNNYNITLVFLLLVVHLLCLRMGEEYQYFSNNHHHRQLIQLQVTTNLPGEDLA
jgi:hypothetical protein